MKIFTTLTAVVIGSFVSLVIVGTLSTFTPPISDNAAASVQTADNAGGPTQTA